MMNTLADVSVLSPELQFEYEFSICCMANILAEYQKMKASFEDSCFYPEKNTEYLLADNSISNIWDAYTAIRHFLRVAKGKYIIISHQDVLCVDEVDKLRNCLNELEASDPTWAICGNAGGADYKLMYYHLSDNGRVRKSNNLPAKIYSLDENFLVIKSAAQLAISADLKGFHLYATDLCTIADILGYSSYVIPFMVNHLSNGNLEALTIDEPIFIQSYAKKLRNRFIQTSCTKFSLRGNSSSSKLVNWPPIFFFVKAFRRLKK